MGSKSITDPAATDQKTFIESINKKSKNRNGKKIEFSFVKRKRK